MDTTITGCWTIIITLYLTHIFSNLLNTNKFLTVQLMKFIKNIKQSKQSKGYR